MRRWGAVSVYEAGVPEVRKAGRVDAFGLLSGQGPEQDTFL